ncbi:hypothetical protein HUJ04_011412, partial [Dendroctonus ponderosae]|uniref:Timeless N-terminal domain-containing protein n=4 Tax=Dendroctonus ponderosae TaxID=77166 RepID=A0AAR5P9T2_DENPD
MKIQDLVESEQDNYDEDIEEEEEGPRYNESNFQFNDFAKRLPHPKIVRACGLALKTFVDNSIHTNHCIVKLLHRIAFDCKMYVMVFQLSIFRSFHEIIKMKELPQHKELVKFATYIIRQFVKVAEVNKKVFMEVLFWKSIGECYEIEHGYTESHGKKSLQKVWSEEEEDEVRRLFMEHQQSGNEQDVVDWITANIIDQTKSRRQILKKLKDLMLLVDYKGRKKSAKSKSSNWTTEEEENLEELFEQFKGSGDPMANILENLEVSRPKNRVIEKLLVMGLIRDKKEVNKKKANRGRK